MRKFLVLLAAASSLASLLAGCDASRPDGLPAGARIIDVRTPEEFASGHLKGAINIPHDEIGRRIAQVTTNQSESLAVHCQSGRRSAIAKASLVSLGYTNVSDLGSFQNARQVTGD